MGGRLVFPGGGVYHGTKYAVEALSDALRFEVARLRRRRGADRARADQDATSARPRPARLATPSRTVPTRLQRGRRGRPPRAPTRGRSAGSGRTGGRRARDREGDLAPSAAHALPGDRLRTASPRAARRPAGSGVGSRGGLELPPPGRAVARTAPELRRAWRFLCGRMRRPQRIATLAVVLLGVAALAVLVARPASSHSPAAPAATSAKPNIVFVLTDDLSWNLVKYMPHVQAAPAPTGMTFTSYFVTDSLCCPSRSSIFTGALPARHRRVHEHAAGRRLPDVPRPAARRARPSPPRCSRAGYRTAMMGKYLNGYRAGR